MQRCRSKVVVLFVSALNATHVGVLRGEYLVNKPLPAAGILADNVRS